MEQKKWYASAFRAANTDKMYILIGYFCNVVLDFSEPVLKIGEIKFDPVSDGFTQLMSRQSVFLPDA